MTHSNRIPVRLNYWLYPLTWIYGFVIAIRNTLFDWGWLPSEEYDVPVFCVGNITVGGTGKTPHVEYLIRLLSNKYQIAVLSRGYKRKKNGFIVLDDTHTASEVGDEPCQIKRKFPSVIVAVDPNRRRGIRKLLTMYPTINVILLDDGFQHRYVRPHLSIMLTNYMRMPYEDALLPVGRLREPYLAARERANVMVVTKSPEDISPIDCRIYMKHLDPYPYQSVFFSSYRYGNLSPLFPSENQPLRTLNSLSKNESVLLLTGIASPSQLIADIEKTESSLISLTFSDHHDFTNRDVKKIEKEFGAIMNDNKLIITTEKDSVRLLTNPYLSDEIKRYIYVLPIEVSITDNTEFDKLFLDYVRKNKRNVRILKK